MAKVGVLGARGRMGREVVRVVSHAGDLEVGAEVDQGDDLDALTGCDVVVDFTHPGVVMENLRWCIAHDLDVVVGTSGFAEDRLDEVRLHRERYTLSAAAADAVNSAHSEGRRIVAVGTTVVRAMEHCAAAGKGRPLQAHSGETDIFIAPGFEFRLVGALLTNFHLPQSSLLMLVSAFAGREPVLAAYAHAVQQKYRFFSYGDCMFLA